MTTTTTHRSEKRGPVQAPASCLLAEGNQRPATFSTKPRILLRIEDLGTELLDELREFIDREVSITIWQEGGSCSWILEVEYAERAVEWLKAKGASSYRAE